jgi:A/G-specific adenine glycosylase
MSNLYNEIGSFRPHTPEEAAAREQLLTLISHYGDSILSRNCEAGHITCSGFILSPDLQKTLMAYHLIYQSVGWTGGHADGDADLLGVALREAMEETSVTRIFPYSRRILSIDILPVPAHEKHGKPVKPHLHYNVTYGLIAPEDQPLADKPDENRNVMWLPVEEIADRCTEHHMLPVYEKLVRRMQAFSAEKDAIPERILHPLLRWYPSHCRSLPWRADKDPYRVWVSEIMLQQTRVEAVKEYYTRFIEALPDIPALAACPEEQLLKLWEGLGYYNRVRNMQKAARQIMEQYGGIFPKNIDGIRSLSGIGDYTAGAIGSICFGLPSPAVDGNVLRVMARLCEDFRNVLSPVMKRDVTAQLSGIYSHSDCGMLTQALMELGATVCVPNGVPRCGECPLSGICMARAAGSTEMLPVRQKKQNRKIEYRTVFVLECNGKIAIRKRPVKGLLASLWELPNTEGQLTPEEAVNLCRKWGTAPEEFLKTVQRRHIFTHITWELLGVFLRCENQSPDFIWATPEELETRYSLPTAFRCVLA